MATAYTQIRTVQYPCIIAGKAVDRFGLFEVDFHKDDTPLRATMLRFVGYDKTADLIAFLEAIENAVYELPALIVTDSPVDFDRDTWDGILYFPRLPILH